MIAAGDILRKTSTASGKVMTTSHLDGEDDGPAGTGASGQDSTANNPFASFAFGGASTPTEAGRSTSSGEKRKKTVMIGRAVDAPVGAKRRRQEMEGKAKTKVSSKKGSKAEGIGNLDAEQLRQLRGRWRSMADRNASVEDQRFQVLVGAVLSSRAQGSVVDEGLSRLRAREPGGLTAAAMADIEQDTLAHILRHVHWNKAKAKHIRESAAMIVRRFHGSVPRQKRALLELPGVGPALVEILVNVFDSWEADDGAEAAVAAVPAAARAASTSIEKGVVPRTIIDVDSDSDAGGGGNNVGVVGGGGDDDPGEGGDHDMSGVGGSEKVSGEAYGIGADSRAPTTRTPD